MSGHDLAATRAPLFRGAALEAQRNSRLGVIVLVRPLSLRVLTAAAAGIACAIAGFAIWGAYTDRTTLSGQLMPAGGVIKILAPQYGTIVEKRVAEGDSVARGDVLYVVSSERVSDKLGPTQETIGARLAARRRSLAEQIDALRVQVRHEIDAIDSGIAGLRAETAKVDGMLEGQRRRLAIAEQALTRHGALRARGFIAEDALLAKQFEVLDQKARLQSLEREQLALARQLESLEHDRRNAPLEYRHRIAELERALADTEREQSENEARRRVAIVAPAAGVVTTVIGEPGQTVETGRALAAVLPHNAVLEAHLYAPSRAMGFVEIGDAVLLRYAAYPYQKFGHHAGTVSAIARAPLPAGDLLGASLAGSNGEPLYRIVVAIESQAISAYGRSLPLQAGMAVEADVLLETRRLYEWVLDPLYAWARTMHAKPLVPPPGRTDQD